jgi:hypothetical protein
MIVPMQAICLGSQPFGQPFCAAQVQFYCGFLDINVRSVFRLRGNKHSQANASFDTAVRHWSGRLSID